MSEKEIIAKAQKMGIDVTQNKEESAMQNIAEHFGMDPNNYNPNEIINRLNEIEDSQSVSNNSVNYDDIQVDDGMESYNSHNRFGEREYNAAKKDGVYDRNYYKSKEEELDNKVNEAKENVHTKTKEETDLDENGNAKWKDGEAPSHRTWENGKETTEGAPTKKVDKTKTEQLKDRRDLLKAQKDRFQNKLNGAKAKAYNTLHPGEALKDKAKSTVKNAAKKVGAKAKATAKKAAGKGAKALLSLIKKNPYVLLAIFALILIIIILVLILSSEAMDGDPVIRYCDTIDDYNFSLKSTPFSVSEFVDKVIGYYVDLEENAVDDSNNDLSDEEREAQIEQFLEEHPCFDFLTNKEILETIYNISIKKKLSPEFSIVHAIISRCEPSASEISFNNYWRLDCGTSYCMFGILDDGVEYLADVIYPYDYLKDYLGISYAGEELTEMVNKYVSLRDDIFYDGNYSFDCDADYIPIGGGGAYPNHDRIFKQNDPEWASIHLGTSAATMGRQGCAVTSIANGINKYASRLNVDSFDAGVFVKALNKGGCFTETGAIWWGCGAINAIAPTVNYVTQINRIGGESNATKIGYLNNYSPDEYFLIIGYKNNSTSGHYVLFNGLIDSNTYSSIDPSPGTVVNHEVADFNQIVVYRYK